MDQTASRITGGILRYIAPSILGIPVGILPGTRLGITIVLGILSTIGIMVTTHGIRPIMDGVAHTTAGTAGVPIGIIGTQAIYGHTITITAVTPIIMVLVEEAKA